MSAVTSIYGKDNVLTTATLATAVRTTVISTPTSKSGIYLGAGIGGVSVLMLLLLGGLVEIAHGEKRAELEGMRKVD